MTELTEMTETTLTDPTVVRAIQLVWREAKLLDDKAYEVWQDLYADDGVYVIPIDPDTEDFASSLNMVYDDKRLRGMRVERMIQGYAPSAVAAARTVRTISRFQVEAASATEVTLTSAQVLVAYKRGRTDVLGAELTHTVRLSDDGDRIALKVVRLLNSEEAVTASGYLL
ncbi:3-phenylpropionate/cinnamic acid dioxygenase, small subunit [Raineyella antarctica]|uniref:3-phenylpropionate/cinnamic acid dioxygenase, small subunit n=1 Tax=Raineyella antarctica TaxID=1577474 RepID=A0A1G6GJN8_9ACTN|nr:aromatic-ring-hydroxylating dioxygenase subunit beta [Raineyella antarctica]SDB81955.1 3-phenylpropionate/cinnamic acid dioxygenase, small subunit [Raineyella antarctica]